MPTDKQIVACLTLDVDERVVVATEIRVGSDDLIVDIRDDPDVRLAVDPQVRVLVDEEDNRSSTP